MFLERRCIRTGRAMSDPRGPGSSHDIFQGVGQGRGDRSWPGQSGCNAAQETCTVHLPLVPAGLPLFRDCRDHTQEIHGIRRLPRSPAGDGKNEPVFAGLHDPFYTVDSRDYQVIQPDEGR